MSSHNYQNLAMQSLNCIKSAFDDIESQPVTSEHYFTIKEQYNEYGVAIPEFSSGKIGQNINKSHVCKMIEIIPIILDEKSEDISDQGVQKLIQFMKKPNAFEHLSHFIAANDYISQRCGDEDLNDELNVIIARYHKHVIFSDCDKSDEIAIEFYDYDRASKMIEDFASQV